MGLVGLYERVQLAAAPAEYTHAAAMGLLAVLAVSSFCVASLRTMLLGGQGRTYGEWLLRLVLVAAVLSCYDAVARSVFVLSDELAEYFCSLAGWDRYWNTVAQELRPLFEDGETSAWDRLVGWLKGGVLTVAVSVSYYLQFVVFEFIRDLSAVIAALLYVLGPLMVVGGLIGSGRSLGQWFGACIQVSLWPTVPPFLMMIMVGIGPGAIATGNTSHIIAQNCILLLLGILSPAIVAFALGRGGVGIFAGAAVGLGAQAMRMTVHSVRELHSKYRAAGGFAWAAAGSGRGAAAGRPDDRPPVVWNVRDAPAGVVAARSAPKALGAGGAEAGRTS